MTIHPFGGLVPRLLLGWRHFLLDKVGHHGFQQRGAHLSECHGCRRAEQRWDNMGDQRWFLGYSKRTFWDICLSYSCDFSFDNIGWYSQKVPNPTLSFWINDSEAHSIHFYWPPLAQIAASTCCQGCIKAARSHKSIPEPRLSISVGRNRQRTPLRWVSNSGLTQSKRHQGGSQVVEGNPTFSVADAIHHHQKLLEMEIKTCHSIARLWNSEWSMSSLVELWWVDLVEMLPASPS